MFTRIELISVTAAFSKPLVLSQLLQYMEGDEKDASEGFTWAGIMIGVALLEGIVSVHLDYQLQRLKLSLRSVLISSVYEKCTLTARHNFGEKSLGEILTLMSTDCDRLAGSVTNLHQLWSVPLQCICVLGGIQNFRNIKILGKIMSRFPEIDLRSMKALLNVFDVKS